VSGLGPAGRLWEEGDSSMAIHAQLVHRCEKGRVGTTITSYGPDELSAQFTLNFHWAFVLAATGHGECARGRKRPGWQGPS
jgi:hypothetical protein